MPHRNDSDLRLLQLLYDYKDKHGSEFRFLVNGRDVKYITIGPGILSTSERTFAPIPSPRLPDFPPGEWNEGYISKDNVTGDLIFSRITESDLPRIKNAWHPVRIDHLSFTKLRQLRQNVHLVTHPFFDRPVIVKFAAFPWQMRYFEAETTTYQWLHGKGIGPEFLGHVTEAGRVIGFIMENIEGARNPEPRDLPACRAVLGKLHSLGIKHGDITKHNFLVRGGQAVLLDFETARRCNDKGKLNEEIRRLDKLLSSPIRRNGNGFSAVTERLIY